MMRPAGEDCRLAMPMLFIPTCSSNRLASHQALLRTEPWRVCHSGVKSILICRRLWPARSAPVRAWAVSAERQRARVSSARGEQGAIKPDLMRGRGSGHEPLAMLPVRSRLPAEFAREQRMSTHQANSRSLLAETAALPRLTYRGPEMATIEIGGPD